MIKTRKQLRECLALDSMNYAKRNKSWTKSFINDLVTNPINDQKYIWNYIKELRYNEFYFNNSLLLKSSHKSKAMQIFFMLFLILSNWKLKKLAYKTGFQIPPNTVGPGLTIWHWGAIIVNPHAKIGRDCVLNPGVIIGHKENGLAPHIGDNCFIGGGAKVIGDIKIGDNVIIAPNAVVVKDVPDNAVVGGVPAKIIKFKDESTSN